MSEAIRNQVVQIAQNELNSRKNIGENVHGETWYNVFEWKGVTGAEGDDNKGDYAENKAKSGKQAWCKAFVVNCVAAKVSGGTKLVSGGWARATGGTVGGPKKRITPDNYTKYISDYKEYAHQIDFPVPGVVWYRPPDGKDGSKSGHVGVVVDVNYNNGYIITIEGNASEKLMSRKYTFGNLKFQNETQYGVWDNNVIGAPTIDGNSKIQRGPFTSFYLMFDENIGSLKNSASKYGGVDLFYKKYREAKAVKGSGIVVSNEPSKKPGKGGGTVVDPSNTNTSSTSETGMSSSEKQQFEIPYMTVAEATDYLKNLSNPNQGNGNGSTTGSIPTTSIHTPN